MSYPVEQTGQVLPANDITLDDVNKNLLSRLNDLINDADADELLSIADTVAKLNASRRNNDQFLRPPDQDEESERERSATIGELIRGR